MLKLRFLFLGLLAMVALSIASCGDDDDPVSGVGDPIASYQFEINSTDFLEVSFTNFSENADSYAWDFGDGGSSTEENPVYKYSAGGDYNVVLTATNSFGSKEFSRTITITDPNEAAAELTGVTSKTWKLSRDVAGEVFPLLVGPSSRSEIWWAYGVDDAIGSRPCLMEEEYIFGADGSFTYVTNGEVFADFGIWAPESEGRCVDDTDPASMTGPGGENLLPWGAGSFTFEFDAALGTLKLDGLGAHVGLPKVATNSEVNQPQASVTYKVISLDTDGPIDMLQLETTIDGGYWQFNLVSYDNPADEPVLPAATPNAGFSFERAANTVTFTNASTNASGFVWDFGDGNTSTQESPSHTYSGDGYYEVTLTATNSAGDSQASRAVVIADNSTFTADVIDGGASKTWTLKPVANAQAVGPGAGSTEWFATSKADVSTRGCAFNDTYTFNSDGSFVYDTQGDVWAEAELGFTPPSCIQEDLLPADYAAFGSGTHTFTATDASLSVSGLGAFVGLVKAYNGGEYAGEPAADQTVTYEVLNYIKGSDTETLILTIDISAGEVGGAYWTFVLESN